MNEKVSRYPLQWPAGWKRTAAIQRSAGKFTRYGKPLSVFDGVQRLLAELERFGVRESDVVISTNVPTRLDGLPRSDINPGDPGAAVYWRDKQTTRCMAIDQYNRVEQNVAALAATIEAMRAIERHGGAIIMERAFAGFVALPAPESWRQVLGLRDDVKDHPTVLTAYRRLRSEHHPDKGGNKDRFDAIEKAWLSAQKELVG